MAIITGDDELDNRSDTPEDDQIYGAGGNDALSTGLGRSTPFAWERRGRKPNVAGKLASSVPFEAGAGHGPRALPDSTLNWPCVGSVALTGLGIGI